MRFFWKGMETEGGLTLVVTINQSSQRCKNCDAQSSHIRKQSSNPRLACQFEPTLGNETLSCSRCHFDWVSMAGFVCWAKQRLDCGSLSSERVQFESLGYVYQSKVICVLTPCQDRIGYITRHSPDQERPVSGGTVSLLSAEPPQIQAICQIPKECRSFQGVGFQGL